MPLPPAWIEDRLPGFQVRIVEQHVFDRAVGDRRARSRNDIDAFRRRHHQPRRDVQPFARQPIDVEAADAGNVDAEIVAARTAGRADAAGFRAEQRDDLAAPQIGDALADRRDLAGSLGANHDRQFALGEGHAAPAPHVDVVERDRADPDLHLAGARRRRLLHFERGKRAVVEKLEGTHHKFFGDVRPARRKRRGRRSARRSRTNWTGPCRPTAARATFGTTSNSIAGSGVR